MTTHPTAPGRRRLPREPFAGARRVVFEQGEVFSAPDDFVLPDLTGVVAEVATGSPEHVRVDSDYYDTDELVLAEAGITLRRDRDGQDWTVVLPSVAAGTEAIRRELHYTGDSEAVPDAIRELLAERLHGARLRPVGHLVIRRVTHPLTLRGGLRLADVVDEHITVYRGDGREESFREIDVQVRDLDGVGHTLLEALTMALVAAGCRLEPPVAELVRAFGTSD